MAQPPINAELQPIYYQLPPQQIVLLKSLLESYEFMGELRTLDSDAGVVVVLALVGTSAMVREMVASESSLEGIREIAAPADFAGDWLLQEIHREE